MERYTKKDAENQLKRLANVLGVQVGYKKGQWFLDKYNGYRVETGDGQTPFGNCRYTAKEFYHLCNFAIRAIQLDRLDGKDSAQYWPNHKCDIN